MEVFIGKSEMTVTLDDSRQQTIGDIIAEITRLEGKDLKTKLMDEHGRSRGAARIVLNDKLLLTDPFETVVRSGDMIWIFPLAVGGSFRGRAPDGALPDWIYLGRSTVPD
jgi:molybdopterin converting factor small subunit